MLQLKTIFLSNLKFLPIVFLLFFIPPLVFADVVIFEDYFQRDDDDDPTDGITDTIGNGWEEYRPAGLPNHKRGFDKYINATIDTGVVNFFGNNTKKQPCLVYELDRMALLPNMDFEYTYSFNSRLRNDVTDDWVNAKFLIQMMLGYGEKVVYVDDIKGIDYESHHLTCSTGLDYSIVNLAHAARNAPDARNANNQKISYPSDFSQGGFGFEQLKIGGTEMIEAAIVNGEVNVKVSVDRPNQIYDLTITGIGENSLLYTSDHTPYLGPLLIEDIPFPRNDAVINSLMIYSYNLEPNTYDQGLPGEPHTLDNVKVTAIGSCGFDMLPNQDIDFGSLTPNNNISEEFSVSFENTGDTVSLVRVSGSDWLETAGDGLVNFGKNTRFGVELISGTLQEKYDVKQALNKTNDEIVILPLAASGVTDVLWQTKLNLLVPSWAGDAKQTILIESTCP